MGGPRRGRSGKRVTWTGSRRGSGALVVAALSLPVVLLAASSGSDRTRPGLSRGAMTWLAGGPAGDPTYLVIEPPLLSKLRTLAAGLHREIALCLRGSARGDTAVARDFFMPEPEHSSATRSVFHACPAGTLATWHNHPLPAAGPLAAHQAGWPTRLERTGSPAEAARLCVLTETDRQTAARLGYPFAVVGVDGETWCWWNLAQVRRTAAGPALPVPGQGIWVAAGSGESLATGSRASVPATREARAPGGGHR
ncbi:MAG: hypothetical protein ACE5HP_10335 [Gemmatimonadota bacterium]